MTTNAHNMTEPATTPTDAPSHSPEWLVGEYHDQTAEWPLHQVAHRLRQDLDAVRQEGLLPSVAQFEVASDTEGPVPVLRVSITGVVDTDVRSLIGNDGSYDALLYNAIRKAHGNGAVVHEIMRRVFGLTNHYNRVHLTRPERSRFIQHITALRPDGAPAIALIGMMHDAITLTPPADPTSTPDAAPDETKTSDTTTTATTEASAPATPPIPVE
jgi:hypothetical protein